MHSVSEKRLAVTCRSCFQQVNQKNLVPFELSMEYDGSSFSISECFIKVTGILMSKNHQDFSKICTECLENLKTSFGFKQKALQSDKIFQILCGTDRRIDFDRNDDSDLSSLAPESFTAHDDEISSLTPIDTVIHNKRKGALGEDIEPKKRRGRPRKTLEQELVHQTEKIFITADIVKVECSICEKSFRSSIYLSKHIKIWHPESITNENDNLDNESKIQEKKSTQVNKREVKASKFIRFNDHDLMYVCDVCSLRFASKKLIASHIKIHDLEYQEQITRDRKNLQCPHCVNSYPTRVCLMRHVLESHLELVVPCPYCHSIFNKRPKCIQHMRKCHKAVGREKLENDIAKLAHAKITEFMKEIHPLWVNEKVIYKCVLCERVLHRLGSLRFHIARDHLNMSFKCFFCTKSFSRKNSYKYHISGKHKNLGKDRIIKALELINKTPIHELSEDPIPEEYKYLFERKTK